MKCQRPRPNAGVSLIPSRRRDVPGQGQVLRQERHTLAKLADDTALGLGLLLHQVRYLLHCLRLLIDQALQLHDGEL